MIKIMEHWIVSLSERFWGFVDFYRWYWHYKLTSPNADIGKISHDLIFQIPWKNEDVVGLCLPYTVRMKDGNQCARQEAVMLVRIPVYGVVNKVSPHTAIV